MVANNGEIREVLTQNFVDMGLESIRVVGIVQVTEMKDHVGPFVPDEPKQRF